MSMTETILQVQNITKRFGGVTAVNNCSLEVERGSVTGLIGPNGAGKTTLFNIISGFFYPDAGKVILKNRDITGLSPDRIFKNKLFRSFQIARDYPEMTVLENLLLVPEEQLGESLFNSWFRAKVAQKQQNIFVDKAMESLRFIGLEQKKDLLAKYLSGGEKKLMEIGRMMMVDLDMVLLDEPGAGVPPALQKKFLGYIQNLSRERGLTLFIVEHDMDIIMNICDRIIVMRDGSMLTQGTPAEVRSNPEVIEAYLGSEGEKAV
ncbi:MAG: ABC transporter ATP-binding protein [Firmicutes bacterium ML8_F2]|jgi:branched-chain amino acid transport system ATP-binding protein|nr:MAG: ABC transporter ATP-binding protein [Firmicutes bacterium ML8_F2]